MSLKPIFEYLDYRDYLKDHYETNKERNSFFSYRYIAGKTGLDSSFYVKVLQKQMHLSIKSLQPMIDFLNLGKKECDFFRLLVRFNRAKNQDESKVYFEKIIKFRESFTKSDDTDTLIAEKYEFFSTWYYVAIRELLNFHKLDNDYKALGMRLNPPINEAKARKAVELLTTLDLVRQNENGQFELTNKFVTTGESWNSVAIENFQKEMLNLAGDSIKQIPKQFRETSTVTISTSWECFKAMKERLREIRKELLDMARMDRNPEGVFQINFQVFPLTSDYPPEDVK